MWRDTYKHLEIAALAAVGVHVAQARRTKIDEAIPARWLEPPEAQKLTPGDARWLGLFTPRSIPLVMVGRLADTTAFFFAVSEDSR